MMKPIEYATELTTTQYDKSSGVQSREGINFQIQVHIYLHERPSRIPMLLLFHKSEYL